MSKKLLIIGFFLLTSKVFALGDFIGGIASEDFVGNGGADINYTYCKEFTPSNTYTLTEMRWYQTDAYLYDIGIYTDDAGTPDTRIVHATGTGASGTNVRSVSGSLTNGTQYWLCKAMQNTDLFLKNIPGNNSISSPTGSSLPSTFSTAFSNVPDYVPNISVYGTVSGPTPTPTPSPTPAPPSTQPQNRPLVEVYLTTLGSTVTETRYHISVNNRSEYRVSQLTTVSPFACVLCNLLFLDPLDPGQTAVLDEDGRYNKETPDFLINTTDGPDGFQPVIFLDGQPLSTGSNIVNQTQQPIVPESCSDIFIFGFQIPDYFCMTQQWFFSVFQWIFGINYPLIQSEIEETTILINSRMPFAYINVLTSLNMGTVATSSSIPAFDLDITPQWVENGNQTPLNSVGIHIPATEFEPFQGLVTFFRSFLAIIVIGTIGFAIVKEVRNIV